MPDTIAAVLSRERPWPLVALLGGVLFAYAPSLGAGFLNYDDDWLISENPMFAPDAWHTPLAAFADFSRTTRLALGAEYLPLRDLLVWLETRCFGTSPAPMHVVSVLIYLTAALFFRGALLRCFGRSAWTEFAALLFALHPVHAESVGWLAGQKDVLALCFVGAALYVHAGTATHRPWSVALCVLAALLSKSMSLAVLGLMVAQDLALRRRPEWRVYAGASFTAALAMTVHVHVGGLVSMVAEPLGGTRINALISMGPVWLRYLELCFFPNSLSIAHDVPAYRTWHGVSLLGYAVPLAWLALGLLGLRRGWRKPLVTFLWVFMPLAPVSQVLVPLQNRMADRYLWLSVMGTCLLMVWALQALAQRWPYPLVQRSVFGVGIALSLAASFSTFDRAATFSDSVLLFADGTRKTEHNTLAPYQLGKAFEARGQDAEAMAAFRIVLARAPSGTDNTAAKATNNLARLLVRRGELPEAERVLRQAIERFPDNPKLKRNLAKVLRMQNREQEAAALDAAAGS